MWVLPARRPTTSDTMEGIESSGSITGEIFDGPFGSPVTESRCIGQAFGCWCWRDTAPAWTIAHGAERFAAAAEVRISGGDRLSAATHLHDRHMARGVAAVILAGDQSDTKPRHPGGDQNRDGKNSEHGASHDSEPVSGYKHL